MRNRSVAAIAIVAVAALTVYLPVMSALVRQWATDDDYSHGFFIVPLALFFAWERRAALARAEVRPRVAGLAIVIASLAVFLAGRLGAELFLTRVSLIGVIAGAVAYVFGWRHLRILAFPIAFLFLMIPLPAIVFNQIAFPLQLLASRAGEFALSSAGVPVLREGNILELASTRLEVVEACSGIRSLVSLLTLGIVLGYFRERRRWGRVLIALATIPIAILANAARVAGTGFAAEWIGPQAAEGFFHTFSGWLMFVLAFAALVGVERVLTARSIAPVPRRAAVGLP